MQPRTILNPSLQEFGKLLIQAGADGYVEDPLNPISMWWSQYSCGLIPREEAVHEGVIDLTISGAFAEPHVKPVVQDKPRMGRPPKSK